MNPSDYGLLWMGQFPAERMILDENSMLPVGMSTMDDITHQTQSMDMNPMMGIVSEYTAATAPGPIAITPEIYPMSSQHTHHDLNNSNHIGHAPQTLLEQYGLVEEVDEMSKVVSSVACGDDGTTIIDDNDMMQGYEEEDMDDRYNPQFDSDNSTHSLMATSHQKSIATQTNKKIKPVKRPGLVLKTPIAYQPCLDPSVIPIQRDGMAVCQRCGAIGVKHSFYTKERRFCSMACARNELERLSYNNAANSNDYPNKNNMDDASVNEHPHNDDGDIELELSASQLQNPHYRFKMSPRANNAHDGVLFKDILPQEELPHIVRGNRLPSPCAQDEKIITVRRKPSEFFNSYDWSQQLNNSEFYAADVTCFRHAPGYEMWSNIGVGMKVEVENTDCDNHGIQQSTTPHSFWVATVLRICGYKALIRYEGYFMDDSHDFWVNLCSSEVHSVGWCATRGKPLIPPRTIENKYNDWKEFLVKQLSGARTLPSTFYNKINDSFKSRFRIGLNLEVVDKNRISQVKLATVQKIVGKRLFVKYFDAPPEDNGFWCHEDSPLIHPVGWAATVGHNLAAPTEYLERMKGAEQMIEPNKDDSVLELFKMNFTFEEYYWEGKQSGFETGMKLEAVDPLNLSSICVATVMAVLKFGYMMIRIDSYDPDATGADWFCYHEKSPCIFPPGFCEANGIILTPPRGYENGPFNWNMYLEETNSIPADDSLFYRELPLTGFKVGMKLECADLMDPRLVCVATIAKIVGRLLKVHFDGWEDEYDQWLDCESPDMYPVGWCVLVNHKLEGPRVLQKAPIIQKTSPKSTARRKRKKKSRLDNGKFNNPNIQTRNNTVKKDKEIFDQQRLTNESRSLAQQNRSQSYKNEPQMEQLAQEDYDEFDEEIYSSYSAQSGRSTPLPDTPEPTISIPQHMELTTLEKQKLFSTSTTTAAVKTNTVDVDSKSNAPVEQAQCIIPRLSDTSDAVLATCLPGAWTPSNVAQFLKINDCSTHCTTFSQNNVDGSKMLNLTKDEIIKMLGMKVGPSLKIFDLIQQLKSKIKPHASRSNHKGNVNKKH